jgi:Skp family chaperone for outer membrane proteins
MASISATNSATPSLQSALNLGRLAQARQQADQAEAVAADLRRQADDAERDAQKSQSKVNDLAAKLSQPDPTYSARALATNGEPSAARQDALASVYNAALAYRSGHNNPLQFDKDAAPVKNNQGDVTGRIVNIAA